MIPLVNDNSPNAINTSLIAVKREIQTLSTGTKNNSNGSGVNVTTELTESINGLKNAVDGLTETLTPGEETSFSCSSAANAEYKEIDIGTADFSNLKEIAVIMTNGNTYGETTTATPTNPKLRVKNGDSILYELAICDCKGHVAGKGFCNAGDIIIFKHVSGKALVTNSDIRESSTSATSGYTIYADGKNKHYKWFYNGTSGTNRILDGNRNWNYPATNNLQATIYRQQHSGGESSGAYISVRDDNKLYLFTNNVSSPNLQVWVSWEE